MREFFRGWRRKVGCLTLVMACLVTGMWMRSLVYGDFVVVNRGVHSNDFLSSFQSGIKWIRSSEPPLPEFFGVNSIWLENPPVVSPRYLFSTTDRFDTDETLMPVFGGSVIEWQSHWNGVGFHFGTGLVSRRQFTVLLIPYWFVTMLVTLLSAYLILWKPRKQT